MPMANKRASALAGTLTVPGVYEPRSYGQLSAAEGYNIFGRRLAPEPSSSEEDGDWEDDEEAEEESDEDEEDEERQSWEQVLQEERELLEQKRGGRRAVVPDLRGEPFSVAFSGGGVRAAAFQAGVLWRLAEEGVLQNVEHLVGVSGGGYVASAFASHVAAADPPAAAAGEAPRGRQRRVNEWYRGVVAKLICRMQRNAGVFVRDCVASPWKDRGEKCPRVCDTPLLLASIAFSLSVQPILATALYLVPIVEFIEFAFGCGMRASFCAPQKLPWLSVIDQFTNFELVLWPFLGLLVVSVVLIVLRHCIPCCRVVHKKEFGKLKAKVGKGYLFWRSTQALVNRTILCLLLLICLVFLAPRLQLSAYKVTSQMISHRAEFCYNFVQQHGADKEGQIRRCYPAEKWFEDPAFNRSGFQQEMSWALSQKEKNADPGFVLLLSIVLARFDPAGATKALWAFGAVGALLLACLSPLVGPRVFLNILILFGPFFCFAILLDVTMFRVFGPLTNHQLFGFLDFDLAVWDNFVFVLLCLDLVLIIMYHNLRSCSHNYLLRTLTMAFFHDGEDISMQVLQDHEFCPLLVLTVIANDFRKPGAADKRPFCEMSLSPLHMGSRRMGYVKMQGDGDVYRLSLGKCMALSGAGGLDAIALTLLDHWQELRFWLESTSLSWGDYIRFGSDPPESALGRLGSSRLVRESCPQAVAWAVFTMPVKVIWITAYVLIMIGVEGSLASKAVREAGADSSWEQGQCFAFRRLFLLGILLLALLYSLSFYAGFSHVAGWTLFSIPIRHCHLLTRHLHRGDQPPPLLYVTDGGALDCTGLVQLVQRRCRRMLMVIANDDPDDNLDVLRKAMELAMEKELATFFDPADPKRDVRHLLRAFQLAGTWQMETEKGWKPWAPPDDSTYARAGSSSSTEEEDEEEEEDEGPNPGHGLELSYKRGDRHYRVVVTGPGQAVEHGPNGSQRKLRQLPEASYLHIGVRYGWDLDSAETGDLFIVKSRLRRRWGYLRTPPLPVAPAISEEEVCGESGSVWSEDELETWGDMHVTDLGGIGCCDCCHTSGLCSCSSCGPFPHLTFLGFLCLSPRVCSSLIRLGHDLSEPAVLAAAGARSQPP